MTLIWQIAYTFDKWHINLASDRPIWKMAHEFGKCRTILDCNSLMNCSVAVVGKTEPCLFAKVLRSKGKTLLLLTFSPPKLS